MANLNEIIVTAAKIDGTTEEDVATSLASAYPDFEIQSVSSVADDWQAVLTKELTDAEFKRLAAFPGEDEEIEEVEETEELPDLEEKEDKPEEEESESSEDGKETSTGTELKDIESLLLELKDEVRKLKEKADVVDEIHESTKPHVDGPELPIPGEEGPGLGGPKPPMGNPGGPKKPFGPPMANVKIAYASINQDGFEFSMTEVAEAMQQKYAGYDLIDMKKDKANNRFIAKLVRK